MRAFLVKLPSSVRYWTVVDDGYRVISASRMSTCSTCGMAVMLRRARRGRMRERKIRAHLRGLKALGLEVTITPAAA